MSGEILGRAVTPRPWRPHSQASAEQLTWWDYTLKCWPGDRKRNCTFGRSFKRALLKMWVGWHSWWRRD